MNTDPNRAPSHDDLMSEAEALIWGLLDDQLEESDVGRLESLLASNESVRRRYAECVQLHADLTEHFSPSTGTPEKGDFLTRLIAETLPNADGTQAPLGE